MPTEEITPSNLLFSYGTLQQGERAQHHLSTSIYLGAVNTVEPFLLVDCGQFPGLIANATHPLATPIAGELYQIPDTLWPALDDYEGVQHGEYRRTKIRVIDAQQYETCAEAYLWLQGWTHLPVVGSSWKTYRRHHFPST